MKSTLSRLELERLETRLVPAFISGNTLMILGGNANDDVVVTENHIANTLGVVQNGTTQIFSSAGITRISAGLGRGNNSFIYQLGGGSDFTDAKSIHVALGPVIGLFPAGANTAFFNLLDDGAGGQAEVRADLGVIVHGSFGIDSSIANFGTVDNADVTYKTRLGLGDDGAFAGLFGDLRNDADLIFDLKDSNDSSLGGFHFRGGNDVMAVFPGKGITPSVDEDASLEVTIKGFSGNDILAFSYEGELDGALFLRMDGGAGSDDLDAVMLLDQRSDGTLDAILDGGPRSDLVHLLLQDDSGGDVTIIHADRVAEA